MARRLAVLTTGRQDFGILRSTIRALDRDPRFELLLWVGGMHLEQRFGSTGGFIEREGLTVSRRLPFLAEPPVPAHDTGRAFAAVTEALESDCPEALLLLGDRAETLAAAFAATILAVPVVHFHGGEESEGAIDNALRHAITKLSHLHLTTHRLHAARVAQMGEDPGTIHTIPPPGVDNLYREDLPSRQELLAELGLPDSPETRLVTVTVHPTTLSGESVLAETLAIAAALETLGGVFIVSMPNSDEGGVQIRDFWLEWARGREGVRTVTSLGERSYWGLLTAADLMIGNSSSGLIEAPAAFLPVVNVGDRQRGRLRHPMTFDVPPEPAAIIEAARTADTKDFRERLRAAEPVFASGPAWPRVLEILADWAIPSQTRKVFHHLRREAGTAPRTEGATA